MGNEKKADDLMAHTQIPHYRKRTWCVPSDVNDFVDIALNAKISRAFFFLYFFFVQIFRESVVF